jgi:phage-related protein
VRAFDVKVRRRAGVRLTAVRMWLAGDPLRVRRRDGRFVAHVDLRRRAQGTYRLAIRAVDARGRVLRGVRTYHTCEPERPRSVPRF